MAEKNINLAIERLYEYTRGSFDPWRMMGPGFRFARQRVMTILLNGPNGKKVPISKSGVTAIRKELHKQAGIEGTCSRDADVKFEAFAKSVMENGVTIN